MFSCLLKKRKRGDALFEFFFYSFFSCTIPALTFALKCLHSLLINDSLVFMLDDGFCCFNRDCLSPYKIIKKILTQLLSSMAIFVLLSSFSFSSQLPSMRPRQQQQQFKNVAFALENKILSALGLMR